MDSSDPTLSSLLSTVPLLPIEAIELPFPISPPSDTDPSSGDDKDEGEEEKKYFCQRCLNHDLRFPRKGHKGVCQYANCPCAACAMVEQRRQLNNMISKKKVIHFPSEIIDGKKVRDPKCARCYAHGIFSRLRGHKKNQCGFMTCNCEACQLVDTRRNLMAKQIRLRRNQKKAMAGGGTMRGIRKGINRLPSINSRNNSPPIVPIRRPIPLVPSSISSLSPSNSISPSLSNSSFYSLDTTSPSPQMFTIPTISPSFITLSLPSPSLPLLLPPPPPSLPLLLPPPPLLPPLIMTPSVCEFLLLRFQILQNIQNNFPSQ